MLEIVSRESRPGVVATDEHDAMRRGLAHVPAWRGSRAVVLRGQQTVERVSEHAPAVALLDDELGERTAVELAEDVAARADGPPLVSVSAAAGRLSRPESTHFAALRVKPFRASELLDDVERPAERRLDEESSGVRARSGELPRRRRVEGA
jgi:DNA-binding response OmpR family regulator